MVRSMSKNIWSKAMTYLTLLGMTNTMIPPLVRNAIVGKIQMMMTLTELITSWRLEKGITRLNLVYLLNFKRQSKYLFLYSGEVLGLDLQPTSKRLQDSEWDQLFRSQCRRFTRKTKMQASIKSKSLRSRLVSELPWTSILYLCVSEKRMNIHFLANCSPARISKRLVVESNPLVGNPLTSG